MVSSIDTASALRQISVHYFVCFYLLADELLWKNGLLPNILCSLIKADTKLIREQEDHTTSCFKWQRYDERSECTCAALMQTWMRAAM